MMHGRGMLMGEHMQQMSCTISCSHAQKKARRLLACLSAGSPAAGGLPLPSRNCFHRWYTDWLKSTCSGRLASAYVGQAGSNGGSA